MKESSPVMGSLNGLSEGNSIPIIVFGWNCEVNDQREKSRKYPSVSNAQEAWTYAMQRWFGEIAKRQRSFAFG